jgi:SAM-dependent methyltransferase
VSATIAVIGCGNIGSRALQALARLETPARIVAVDPEPSALARARARVLDLGNAAQAEVLYADSIAALPYEIDLALVATRADTRRAAVEALLDHARVRDLVLEKILFQLARDYTAVGERLATCGTRCWVNLVRRAWPGYQALRRRLGGDRRLEMLVLDPDFNLASNAVHFLDLYAFLTGVPVSMLDGSGMDLAPAASRHSGFRELTGVLRGQGADGARVMMAAHPQSKLPPVIQFITPALHWIVDEVAQKAHVADAETAWSWREIEFPTLLMSGMTSVFAEILEGRGAALPSYEAAARDHLKLIELFNWHWFGATSRDLPCPIT